MENLESLISIAESETMAYCKSLSFGRKDLQYLLFRPLHYFPEKVCWRSTAADPGGHRLIPHFGTLYSFSVFNSLTV